MKYVHFASNYSNQVEILDQRFQMRKSKALQLWDESHCMTDSIAGSWNFSPIRKIITKQSSITIIIHLLQNLNFTCNQTTWKKKSMEW